MEFRTCVINAQNLEGNPNLLSELFFGNLEILIVKGAFARDAIQDVNQLVTKNKDDFFIHPSQYEEKSKVQTHVLGVPLTPSRIDGKKLDLAFYCAQASIFQNKCVEKSLALRSLKKQLHVLFERLSGPQKVEVFEGEHGSYTPFTIRIVPPECEIPIHSGLEFLTQECYQELNKATDHREQLSFFTILNPAQQGGELFLYELDYYGGNLPMKPNGSLDKERALQVRKHEVKIEVGDLLLFTGGRWFHCVAPVYGNETRRTLGGFMSFSKDHTSIYYWS